MNSFVTNNAVLIERAVRRNIWIVGCQIYSNQSELKMKLLELVDRGGTCPMPRSW